MFKHQIILSLLFILTSSACIAQEKFVPPLPPISGFEFFDTAKGTHTIEYQCENSRSTSSISWAFDGHSIEIETFSFNGQNISSQKLLELNAYAQFIEEDFTVWIRCGNQGASITMDGSKKSTGNTNVSIKLNWVQATKSWKLIRKSKI